MPQFQTCENSNITTLQTAEYFVYMSHYEGPLAIVISNISFNIQHSTRLHKLENHLTIIFARKFECKIKCISKLYGMKKKETMHWNCRAGRKKN